MEGGNFSNPDYKNLQYDEDGTLDFGHGESEQPRSFGEHIKQLGEAASMGATPSTHNYENTKLRGGGGAEGDGRGRGDTDYVNDMIVRQDHTYSNHEDLLLQVHKCTQQNK